MSSSKPQNIRRKESSANAHNTLSVGSYSSIPRSVPKSTSRRLSTARLGSPVLDDHTGSSPRTPRSLHMALGMTSNGPSTSNLKPGSVSSSSSSAHVLVDPENPSFESDIKDQRAISENINQYFNEGLATEGGDITHNLKKPVRKSSSLKRVHSHSDLFDNRRGSASQINVPGGFRREFIVNKARERAILNDEQLSKIPFMTKNFMEFLYIYGHFAGEDFEDDFGEHSGDSTAVSFDESTPLLDDNNQLTRPVKSYEARGTTTTTKAFFIMLKAFVGTGVLFLPRAFYNGGLLFSIVMLLVFGAYSYYCYYTLVLAKTYSGVSSFGDIGGKLYGKWFKNLILFSLILTQVGFVCAYIIFTTENLSAFVYNVTGWNVTKDKYFILQAIIFIPLSFIRNVSKLSLPSFMANFFILIGLVIVLFFTSLEIYQNGTKPIETIINQTKFSLFIGTAIFAFEGIGLIIPIQDSMKHPEKFPLVLLLVIITITILMTIIASIGYLAYGEDIQTVILLNLPQTNFFVQLIQFFYSLAILLSTPLQLFPAIGLVEKLIFKKKTGKHDNKIKWYKNFLRTCFVLICINIAFFGADDLDRFVSFVGCFACIPLVYMYPPLLHLKTLYLEKDVPFKDKVVDIILVIFGGISMLYTSYQIIFG